MARLFVILPCYNEEADIQPLIRAWAGVADRLAGVGLELAVVAVDDGSKDRTREVIEALAVEIPGITLLVHEVNQGLGAGVSTGLAFFHAHGEPADRAVIMDADNTHDPKFVFAMLDKLADDGLDCVIASRYCAGSRTVGVPAFRGFLSWGARVYYRVVLGVRNVRDYTCGYRVYTYDIIDRATRRYGERLVEERGFSCMMELLFKLSRVGARFGEVPFELRYDAKQGESKMRVVKTVRDSLLTAPRLRWTVR